MSERSNDKELYNTIFRNDLFQFRLMTECFVSEFTSGDLSFLLRVASKSGSFSIVKYLVEDLKADVHDEQEEALRNSAQRGHDDIFQYLVLSGADLKVAMRAARQYDEEEAIEWIKSTSAQKKEQKILQKEVPKDLKEIKKKRM